MALYDKGSIITLTIFPNYYENAVVTYTSSSKSKFMHFSNYLQYSSRAGFLVEG